MAIGVPAWEKPRGPRLRPLRPSDAGLLSLYASDARVARMTLNIPHPYPPGTAETYIDRILSQRSGEIAWAIDVGEDGGNGLVGLIGIKPHGEASAEVGYWVAPAFWGAGHATRAVEAVTAEARARGFAELTAQVFQDNAASIRVLTRCGFDYVGDGEAHSVARGGMAATHRYRLALGGA
jgi:RimJ/RimL family protein N-acetyltransferase